MNPAAPPLRVGIVGYGLMGKAHSYGYRVAPLVRWPGEPWTPGFADGATVQAVCDAMESSAAPGRWVSVAEVIARAQPRG